jgi:O-antigen ligase
MWTENQRQGAWLIEPSRAPAEFVAPRAEPGVPGMACADRLLGGIWPRSIALWMAAFYIALYILRPWEMSFAWMNDFHFERVYAICMILAVLFSLPARALAGRPYNPLRPVTDLQTPAVLLFVAAMSLSTLFAYNFDAAWDKFYVAITVVAFFFVLRFVVRTPYELVFLATCYIVAMAVYLLKAQWEYFRNGRHDYTMGVTRLIGIEASQGGPNALAISVVISLPIWLFLVMSRKEFTASWPSFWRKLFAPGLAAYLVLAISSMILTRSRTGFVTFVVFLGLVALRMRGVERKILAGLAGLVVLSALWFVVSDEARNRIRTIWDPEAGPANAYASAMGRVEGFRAGLEMFNRNPFTGVGPGNFIPYRVANVDGVPLEAHNLVGQVLGETGICGAMVFVFLVAVTLINCRRTSKLGFGGLNSQGVANRFSVACRDTILLLLFEGLFDHNMTRFNWLWVAAFVSVALRFATAEAERNKSALFEAYRQNGYAPAIGGET